MLVVSRLLPAGMSPSPSALHWCRQLQYSADSSEGTTNTTRPVLSTVAWIFASTRSLVAATGEMSTLAHTPKLTRARSATLRSFFKSWSGTWCRLMLRHLRFLACAAGVCERAAGARRVRATSRVACAAEDLSQPPRRFGLSVIGTHSMQGSQAGKAKQARQALEGRQAGGRKGLAARHGQQLPRDVHPDDATETRGELPQPLAGPAPEVHCGFA